MATIIDTSYEPFSREPEYIEGNREFLNRLPLKDAEWILDLACGTGTISELILERNGEVTIFGLDISRESLALGQTDFAANGLRYNSPVVMTDARREKSPRLILIEGSADALPLAGNWADLVFMGHSIHMLPDADALLAEVRRVLRPGGLFAFNSSFYAGSQAPGTDAFYQHWWKGALRYILELDADRKRQGLPGVKRQRGTTARAFSSDWPSGDEWRERLTAHGFAVESISERTIMMSQRAFETIGAYAGFARLMVSGYPVELASEALVKAVAPALAEVKKTELPRLWLEVVASASN